MELKRDGPFFPESGGPGVDELKAYNLAIAARKKKIRELTAEGKKFIGLQPEQIIQRYVVGVKQQIGDIRSALASDLASYRKNYEQAGKPERVDAERPNELIARLDNADAAQLAAQTFLDLYFSGDIEKATELTNNPRPLKTLREFINPGTSAAPKVDGFSGGRLEASISTDGVVQLKKALPRTGHKQATISLRMQNNDSDGWRVLQVFLGGVTTARRKATNPKTTKKTQPIPAINAFAALATPTISNASPNPRKPQRTDYGLVYCNKNAKYKEAVAVKVIGDVCLLKIVDGRADIEPGSPSLTVGAKEVTITAPSRNKSTTTFVLPAVDTDKNGEASVFTLESPDLAAVMKRESYTVSFESYGRRQVYKVQQYADLPLVPRLQVVSVRQFEPDEKRKSRTITYEERELLPWAFPDRHETQLYARRFFSPLIDKDDILTAVALPNVIDGGNYQVKVKLTPEAAKRTAKASKRMAAERGFSFAVLVDGKVTMAPREIDLNDNSFIVTGNFTQAKAEDLAASLAKWLKEQLGNADKTP